MTSEAAMIICAASGAVWFLFAGILYFRLGIRKTLLYLKYSRNGVKSGFTIVRRVLCVHEEYYVLSRGAQERDDAEPIYGLPRGNLSWKTEDE